MQGLGGFLVLMGAGSFVLHLINMEFMLVSWVDNWGTGVGNGIRIAMIVVGGILWLLGRQVPCVPLAHGGGHERDIRSGTQDTASIAGMAAALHAAITDLDATTARLVGLRDALVAGIEDGIPEAILNGPRGANRLPGNVHFTFPGCEGDSLLMLLDAAGIECSTGSACTAGVTLTSWRSRSTVTLAAATVGRSPVTSRRAMVRSPWRTVRSTASPTWRSSFTASQSR